MLEIIQLCCTSMNAVRISSTLSLVVLGKFGGANLVLSWHGILNNLQMIVNRSRADWRASVTKIPIRIEDIEKVPSVSEEIRVMLRSNPNVSNSDVPYCYLSRLESSYGELTIGCNLKNMVCLICCTSIFMLLYRCYVLFPPQSQVSEA